MVNNKVAGAGLHPESREGELFQTEGPGFLPFSPHVYIIRGSRNMLKPNSNQFAVTHLKGEVSAIPIISNNLYFETRSVRCYSFEGWATPIISNNLTLISYHRAPPVQKQAQLDDDKHQHLFDICCVWRYLQPKLAEAFPQGVVDKYNQMFQKGFLGLGICWPWLGI